MKGSTVFRSKTSEKKTKTRDFLPNVEKKKHGLYPLYYYAAGLRCAKCDQFFPFPSR